MKIIANGLQIEVDVQGPEHGEPILLVMGLGMQLVAWPKPFCEMLVAAAAAPAPAPAKPSQVTGR